VRARVGTSGWSYQSWRNRFYPPGLPPGAWYDHVLSVLDTVEVNASFYRLPKPGVFASWGARTPAGARIAVKASRYLTHVRRLRDPAEPVARLMSRASELGPALGPILVQLPPDLPADLGLLAGTLRCFPPRVRVAVEPRHPSWWSADCRALLESAGAALVWADRRSRPVTPLWRTADFGYLRLHEGAARAWPHYGEAALHSWAGRLAAAFPEPADVFVYFNNDPEAAAPADALRLRAIVDRAAGEPSAGARGA
jgi:uncharacterized protein YecE (DUF72 family)